jgi:hypothetical protein
MAVREEAIRELREKVGDKDQALAEARAEQERAAKAADEMKLEYEAKVAELAGKENMESQYKELLRTLVESKTVEALQSAKAKKNSTVVNDLKPGSIWAGDKGSRRLTLSVNFRELYDTKTGTLLREVHGEEATNLARAWLEIKPQGGRIFVDDTGIATAYRGEDLIYLGLVGFDL